MRTTFRAARLAVSAALFFAVALAARPALADTVLHFQSQTGDFLGQGATRTIRPSDGYTAFAFGIASDFGVGFSPVTPGVPDAGWFLALGAPEGIAIGAYENLTNVRWPFDRPFMNFSGGSRSCAFTASRMVVREIAFDAGGLVSLAVDFEQHCEKALPALFGQLRFNSSVPIDTARTHPDPWLFPGVTGQSPGQETISAAATITGIDVPLPISVSGGEYSVDDGPFTSSPGLVANGQSVRVRVMAPATPNAFVTATLRVGDYEAPFRVGTAPGTEPQPNGDPLVVVVAQPGRTEGGTFVHGPATLDVITVQFQPSDQSVQVGVNGVPGGGGLWWGGDFAGPLRTAIAPGTYTGALPNAIGEDSPFLRWAGYSPMPWCTTDAIGTFTVHEVEYAPPGAVSKLAVDFEQRCAEGSNASAVIGHVRYNSVYPIDYAVRLPHPFSFPPQYGVAPSAVVESNEFVVEGINVPVGVAVAGGEYSIDGAAYVSTPGTISAGQRLRLRVAAPAEANAVATARLDVGTRSAEFLVATAPGATPQSGGRPLMVVRRQPFLMQPGSVAVYSPATQSSLTFARSGSGVLVTAPASPLTGTSNDGYVVFAGLGGSQPLPGEYASVAASADATHATLVVISEASICRPGAGFSRFVIHEIEYSPMGQVVRLAIDYTTGCPDETGAGLFGHVRLNSSVPIDYSNPLPNPYSFAGVAGADPGAVVTSEEVLIDGMDLPVSISASGGEYSVDSGPFVASPGTIAPGQRARLRLAAPSQENAVGTAELSVGKRRASFRVGTRVGTNPQPNGEPLLVLVSEPGDPVGQGATRIYSGAQFDSVAVAYSTCCANSFSATSATGPSPGAFGYFGGVGSGGVSVREYPEVSITGSPTQGRLDVRIEGRGCSSTSGRLQVYEAYDDQDPTRQRFAFDFVQYCDGAGAPLRGYLRYRSNVPIDLSLDAVPGPFSFGSVTGAPRGQWVASAAIPIGGINTATSVTVESGEVSIDGGPFGASAATMHAGQTVRVRLLSSGNHDELRSATVTIGGVAGSFSVRTLVRPTIAVSITNGIGGRIVSQPAGIDCPGVCTAGFDEGVPVALTAVPAAGAIFSGWTGACAGLGTCQLTLPGGSATAGAGFAFPLSVSRLGTGTGTVHSWPAGIACGSSCAATFPAGTTATLVAAASAGSRFTGWAGSCSGTSNCVVTLDGVRSVIATFAPAIPTPDNARADWNGDGRPDLILRFVPSGGMYLCYMDGLYVESCEDMHGPEYRWKLRGAADFDRDGRTDLVWHDTVNGKITIWLMSGATKLGEADLLPLEAGWALETVADFNADGAPDLLLRHTGSNQLFVMFFDGTTPVGAQFLVALDANWRVDATGDFDRDGHPDLMLRHVNGLWFLWRTGFVSGSAVLVGSPAPLFALNSMWMASMVADWNGDGNVDVVVQHPGSGEVFVLYFSGSTFQGADYIIRLDTGWTVMPRNY